jgi:uncharacterized membrane protein (DUF373 family)
MREVVEHEGVSVGVVVEYVVVTVVREIEAKLVVELERFIRRGLELCVSLLFIGVIEGKIELPNELRRRSQSGVDGNEDGRPEEEDTDDSEGDFLLVVG